MEVELKALQIITSRIDEISQFCFLPLRKKITIMIKKRKQIGGRKTNLLLKLHKIN